MVGLTRLAAKLPETIQNELKRIHYRRLMRRNRFVSPEPEYRILPHIVKPGDWVIDVGANVGHYTKRLSELVGRSGRVLSFEPVPTTFSFLAANSSLFTHANVTLFNIAVSNKTELVGISVPYCSSGLKNYYLAQLTNDPSGLRVMTVSIDSLDIAHRVSLVKIDTEGYEDVVLQGMEKTLLRDLPVLIVETNSRDIEERLSAIGYTSERLKDSPNILFRHNCNAGR